MDELRIDTTEVGKLAAQIDHAVEVLPREIRAVVQRGAFNIKRDAQKRIGRGPYLPAYARSISYDSRETPTGAWAEIGPDKDRPQGPLGNILEYGSPGRAPIPHLAPALAAEAPRFEKALEDVVLKALGL
ncbi:hypothetical protein [Actinoplanes teichomyceticus]|uniref:HK97 gp10 family phage protein n=1 Tax=Actinoplanes teichomyceticus TaxID=1867 RepID=A0A561WAT5_ACTTI|nr:hypothetical protein [Actinoplanes teichomyceticus]TWG20969.1 hypothetical protein FHX34_103498 [Actinoplanes teichomyceticus]GIF14788.1 hypothetical protein Ate01nite_48200 [Actinoplanes teichomyceticus]